MNREEADRALAAAAAAGGIMAGSQQLKVEPFSHKLATSSTGGMRQVLRQQAKLTKLHHEEAFRGMMGKIDARQLHPADGSQIHVRGIGVHGWDGTEDGRGAFESATALKKLMSSYGTVIAATIRHRVDMGGM